MARAVASWSLGYQRPNGAGHLVRERWTGGCTDLTSGHDYVDAIAIQPDGKTVAAGLTDYFGSAPRFALIRYQANGETRWDLQRRRRHKTTLPDGYAGLRSRAPVRREDRGRRPSRVERGDRSVHARRGPGHLVQLGREKGRRPSTNADYADEKKKKNNKIGGKERRATQTRGGGGGKETTTRRGGGGGGGRGAEPRRGTSSWGGAGVAPAARTLSPRPKTKPRDAPGGGRGVRCTAEPQGRGGAGA